MIILTDAPWPPERLPNTLITPSWVKRQVADVWKDRLLMVKLMDLRESVGAPIGVGETVTIRRPKRFESQVHNPPNP